MEQAYFVQDAPSHFPVYFENENDELKALILIDKYGPISCKKEDLPGHKEKLCHIISRTQYLALKDSGIQYFPKWDKYLTDKGKSIEQRVQSTSI